MTRTDHKNYIASEWWLQRRKLFLVYHIECNRCGLPREKAKELYDQDLHVHHRNYQNKGAEKDVDLEALCRRCHEWESTSKSSLPKWNPNHPIMEPMDHMAWLTDKTVFKIVCPQCGFDYNHFSKVPVFVHDDHDEPHLILLLNCENSHLWKMEIRFDHGGIYVVPEFIKNVTPDDADFEVLR